MFTNGVYNPIPLFLIFAGRNRSKELRSPTALQLSIFAVGAGLSAVSVDMRSKAAAVFSLLCECTSLHGDSDVPSRCTIYLRRQIPTPSSQKNHQLRSRHSWGATNSRNLTEAAGLFSVHAADSSFHAGSPEPVIGASKSASHIYESGPTWTQGDHKYLPNGDWETSQRSSHPPPHTAS